ncbi:unnamed protein product, partial [Lampetra planeri]
ASRELLQQHYIDLKDRPFYPGLVEYMHSGACRGHGVAGGQRGEDCAEDAGGDEAGRLEPGTIRGDFAVQVGRNIIHGSDSVENAEKEIALWFTAEEVTSWKSCAHDWVYE